MTSEVWNLVAAVLCTVSAAVVTAAAAILVVADSNLVNELAVVGGLVGVLSGVAWSVSAAKAVRRK